MLLNMAFDLVPFLIGGAFFYTILYLICAFVSKKLSKTPEQHSARKKSIRDFLVVAFCFFTLIQTYKAWNVYGYRVEANPFGHVQQQYEPQKTDVQSGSKLIEYEDKTGDFHERAKESPQ